MGRVLSDCKDNLRRGGGFGLAGPVGASSVREDWRERTEKRKHDGPETRDALTDECDEELKKYHLS